MKTIDATPAATTDLSEIGVLYDLNGTSPHVVSTTGPGWQDHYTADPLLLGPAHLGHTTGPASDEPVRVMERHMYTAEAVLPMAEALVLPICTQPTPVAEAVQALTVQPGQVLVLNLGVWHAPALGLAGPVRYCWLADVDEAVESEWVPIEGGPVQVRS